MDNYITIHLYVSTGIIICHQVSGKPNSFSLLGIKLNKLEGHPGLKTPLKTPSVPSPKAQII